MAQNNSSRSYSLDEAIHTVLKNNPEITCDSVQKQLVCEIKSSWNSWIYCINKSLLLNEFHQSLSDLSRITELRYESGDIDFHEAGTMMNKMAEIITALALSENDALIYQNRIRQLMYFTGDFQPMDSSFDMYEVDKSSAHLNDDRTFSDSSLIGYRKFVHDLEIENRKIELDNLFIKLQYFVSFSLDYADKIMTMATARLKSEEIDYLEYAVFITDAFKIRLDYLDVLNEYNQCALQFECYEY